MNTRIGISAITGLLSGMNAKRRYDDMKAYRDAQIARQDRQYNFNADRMQQLDALNANTRSLQNELLQKRLDNYGAESPTYQAQMRNSAISSVLSALRYGGVPLAQGVASQFGLQDAFDWNGIAKQQEIARRQHLQDLADMYNAQRGGRKTAVKSDQDTKRFDKFTNKFASTISSLYKNAGSEYDRKLADEKAIAIAKRQLKLAEALPDGEYKKAVISYLNGVIGSGSSSYAGNPTDSVFTLPFTSATPSPQFQPSQRYGGATTSSFASELSRFK